MTAQFSSQTVTGKKSNVISELASLADAAVAAGDFHSAQSVVEAIYDLADRSDNVRLQKLIFITTLLSDRELYDAIPVCAAM